MNDRDFTVILAAGGVGRRTGLHYPKQLYEIEGKPIIRLSAELFAFRPEVREIIIVSEEKIIPSLEKIFSGSAANEKFIRLTPGADTRQGSVAAGLRFVNTPYVLIHDAVRPFASGALIDAVIQGTREEGACIPAVRPKDSVKLATDGFVESELSRDCLIFAQTPQGFLSEALKSAYENAFRNRLSFTDDAEAARHHGMKIRVCEGDYGNIKITTETDLALANAMYHEFCKRQQCNIRF